MSGISVLPDELAEQLPDASPACDAATDAQVAAFLAEHTQSTRPNVLQGLTKVLRNRYDAGDGRHPSTPSVLAGAMKEARLGLYPAQAAADTLKEMFLTEVAKPPASGKQGKPRTGAVAASEFNGILAWAIAQALAADLDEVRARVDKEMFDNHAWTDSIASNGQAQDTGNAAGRRGRITWANTITPEPVVWAWKGDLEDDLRDLTAGRARSSSALKDYFLRSWGSCTSEHVSVGESGDLAGQGVFRAGRIAAGTVAVGAGSEGLGKSSFGVYIAAKVSTGELPGAWYGTPQAVLYVAVEDSWKHTIVPRLLAAGADTTRIGRFDVITETDEVMHLSLPVDNALLEQTISDHNVALVVLDPLMSLISDRIDTHREREVRRALDPIVGVAERTGAVIFGVAHFNKGTGTDVSARITGSGAFKNVPRAVFGFAHDPETGDFVITQSKNSLGRSDLPSLRYRMESVQVNTPTGPADTGRFVPLGVSERSVGDILAATTPKWGDDRGPDGLTPAQRFITGYIREHKNCGGEVHSREVIAAGAAVGYTEKDLVNARNRARAKILTRRSGRGEEDGWYWRLAPETPPDQQDLKNSEENGRKTPSDQQGLKISEEDTLKDDRRSCTSEARSAERPEQPPCTVCGQPMCAPASIQRGVCERCHLAAKRADS